jgi:ferrous iron transport protein B
MFFGWFGGVVQTAMPDGPLESLLVSGVIDGVGGVLGFVPLIAFMFFAIAILEDSGYMARIAFIMDRVLRTFGLHGSSVLALMVGGGLSGGCAVPGVMAARTLRDPKERLATILVTPFMNCGAKLPVYAVLIAAFFSGNRGQMFFLLTLIAWSMALVSARILRWTILKGEHTPFVMELPPYRLPTLRGLLIHTWERVWSYVKKAGTVVLGISILLWVLMSYPNPPEDVAKVFEFRRAQVETAFLAGPGGEYFKNSAEVAEFATRMSELDEQTLETGEAALAPETIPFARAVMAPDEAGDDRVRAAAKDYLERRESLKLIDEAEGQTDLRYSAAGRIGTLLEKLTKPLGFDWRVNIALVGGFAAKEVVVSTLGTAYSMSEAEDDIEESLSQKLAREKGWNKLTAFVLMLFVMLYAPCFVTLVVIGREAGWRWSLFAATYNTLLAYLVALAAAVVGRALGLGL